MDISSYLKRIGYHGKLLPDAETLRKLQFAHMMSIPFENLSIHLKEPIILDKKSLFDKIIIRKRGGFCYELNGLFAAFLRELGFKVIMLSAGVAKTEGGFGPEFDHMTLMVTVDGKKWLTDVGFGDSFLEPLLLESSIEQVQGNRTYRLYPEEDSFILMQRNGNGIWKAQYRFSIEEHEFPEYFEMCRYHQTSPDSHFTQKKICTIALPEGRITISGQRLIITKEGKRMERQMEDGQEYNETLRKYFGIVLPEITVR